jgi:cellulose synthase/poly-beta-1,6-N-acetylglucosamine synthase-like glycosyltransferase
VRVLELRDEHPTPGRGRNAGMAAATRSTIQFLDGDTVLDPAWLKTALPRLEGRVGAVVGRLQEKHPRKNAFHAIADLEWNISAGMTGNRPFEGPAQVFGGIVLARKEAFLQAGGYDGGLVAGEDPDLSFRVRTKGWTILKVDADMAAHDLDITSLGQYLRRACRSGYAMAQIGLRYAGHREHFYLDRLARAVLGALVPPAVLALGVAVGRGALGAAAAAAIAFRSFRKITSFTGPRAGLSTAALYCLHLSFVPWPQLAGVLRYLLGRAAGLPLRNRGCRPRVVGVPGDRRARVPGAHGNTDHAER